MSGIVWQNTSILCRGGSHGGVERSHHAAGAHAGGQRLGFGASPELQAWRTLLDWAKAGGLLDAEAAPRFFGFNNPNPAHGSPNYGYEQWMTVGPDVAGGRWGDDQGVRRWAVPVTRCEGLQTITDSWHRLATWCEGSPYIMGQHQWLEECFTPDAARIEDYVFDLYLPIAV